MLSFSTGMAGYSPGQCGNRNSSYEERRSGKYKQSGEPQQDLIDDLLGRIKAKEQENDILRKRNLRIEQDKEETEKRSKQLTDEMAKVMDMKGTFENTDDEYNNSKLSEAFQKMYSNDWVKLSRWIAKSFPAISELQVIHYLTELMKRGYQECLRVADAQIRSFLLLDETEADTTNDQHQELFYLRRKHARRNDVRAKIKKLVLESLPLAQGPSDCFSCAKGDTAKREIKDFFNNYLECCWLMVVSNPPMRLNFDVVDNAYRSKMEEFSIFSLKIPVEDMNKEEGAIYEVVWPSICLQDGSSIYQKGDVVIVKKGYQPEQTDCSCCSFNSYNDKADRASHCINGDISAIAEKRSAKTSVSQRPFSQSSV